jgi:hypothetical protein
MKLFIAAILMIAQIQVASACNIGGTSVGRHLTNGMTPRDVLEDDTKVVLPVGGGDAKDEG